MGGPLEALVDAAARVMPIVRAEATVVGSLGQGEYSRVHVARRRVPGTWEYRALSLRKFFTDDTEYSTQLVQLLTRNMMDLVENEALRHEHLACPTECGLDPERAEVFTYRPLPDGAEYLDARQLLAEPESATLLKVGIAVARAQHHLHKNGRVHRDVNPSNIFVARREGKIVQIVLGDLDFIGVRRHLMTVADHHQHLTEKLSRRGVMIGTPAYWPDRVFQREMPLANADGTWLDKVALGRSLAELGLGAQIHVPDGRHGTQVLHRSAWRSDPRILEKARERLGKRYEAIVYPILRATEEHEEDNYPGADEFATDLERVLEGETRPVRRANIRSWRRAQRSPGKRGKRRRAIALTTLALLCGGGTEYASSLQHAARQAREHDYTAASLERIREAIHLNLEREMGAYQETLREHRRTDKRIFPVGSFAHLGGKLYSTTGKSFASDAWLSLLLHMHEESGEERWLKEYARWASLQEVHMFGESNDVNSYVAGRFSHTMRGVRYLDELERLQERGLITPEELSGTRRTLARGTLAAAIALAKYSPEIRAFTVQDREPPTYLFMAQEYQYIPFLHAMFHAPHFPDILSGDIDRMLAATGQEGTTEYARVLRGQGDYRIRARQYDEESFLEAIAQSGRAAQDYFSHDGQVFEVAAIDEGRVVERRLIQGEPEELVNSLRLAELLYSQTIRLHMLEGTAWHEGQREIVEGLVRAWSSSVPQNGLPQRYLSPGRPDSGAGGVDTMAAAYAAHAMAYLAPRAQLPRIFEGILSQAIPSVGIPLVPGGFATGAFGNVRFYNDDFYPGTSIFADNLICEALAEVKRERGER